MTKTLATERLRLGLADWLNAVTSPIGIENSLAGSWFQRSPAGPTDPVEILLNTSSGANGWVKQNLVNLDVFNVTHFGAVGNGVTGDTDAIKATIDAADAAGGGIIYFPPGSWVVEKRLTALASFAIKNMHNLLFMGDGFASKILMIGDGTLADWYLFYITDGSSNIKFSNLYIDGAGVTNPDPGEQTHLIYYATETTDANGGSHDGDVVGCYFGPVDGDCIRFLGTRVAAVDKPTFNHHVEDNSILSTNCRTGVAGQRYAHRIKVIDNYLTGSNDQDIDLEPSGGSPPDNTPQTWIVMGNHNDHSGQNVTALTLNGNGAASPSTRSVFAYNYLFNFSMMEMRDAANWAVVGNILLYTAATGGDFGLSIADGASDLEVAANVFDRPNRTTQLYRAINVTAGTGTRQRLSWEDNIARTFGDAGGGIGMAFQNNNDSKMRGNIVTHDNATANVSAIFLVSVSTEPVDGSVIAGNMGISINAALLAAFQVSTTGAFALGNALIYGNYGRGASNGLRMIVSGGGSFTDWKGAIDNNFTAITGSIVAINSFTNGVTIEGNPGPSSRFIQCNATPVAAVPSVSGSVALNTGGTQALVLFYKETAASPTDTAGWISTGPGDYMFAAQSADVVTAARFLATGIDLLVASSTEIQLAAPRPGTMRSIFVDCVAGIGAATVTYTYRKNGVSQALTAAIANTATGGSGTGAIAFVAGDLHSVQITKSAVVATAQTMVVVTLQENG
jgi:hypothetical protein